MASNGSLAEYFIRLGVKVDKGELNKIDRLLSDIEKRLKGVGKAQVAGTKATEKSAGATKKEVRAQNAKEAALKASIREQGRKLKLQEKELSQAKKLQAQSNTAAKQEVANIKALTTAAGKNAAAWKKQFKASVSGLTPKASSGRLLNERQKMYDSLFGATSKGQPFKSLTSRQVGANRRAFFANTRGLEVRSGYNSQYRLGEQRAANAAKSAAERLAAEKAVNKKIEEERKKHADRLARIENSRLIHQRAMDRIYGRVQAQQRLQQQAQQNWLERQRIRQEQMQARVGRSGASYGRANFLHAGGAAGALARYGAGALPFVGGVYGLASLNQANQEAVSARLTTQAVVQAQGLDASKGVESFEWLRKLGFDVGFNYMDAAPRFNQFLSNSLGAGVDVKGSQDIYRGFAEYQTAMGVTSSRRKLVENALSQMLGKQTISMEELKRQMSESLPGTMAVFAEAYAESSGSGLVGDAALKALYEAVPEGKVKAKDVLPVVARIMREKAAPKIDVMKKTSIAEQGRFGGNVADLVKVFSDAGGEQGFYRMWSGFNSQLRSSVPLAESFGRSFEFSARQMQKLLTWTESFNNAIEGKDSQVADWLGAEKTAQLKQDWAEIKSLMDQIFNQATPAWLPTMEDITKRLSGVLRMIAEISQWKSASGSAIYDAYKTEGVLSAGWMAVKTGGVLAGKGVGSAYQNIAETIPNALLHPAVKGAYDVAGWAANLDSNMFANDYWKSKNIGGSLGDANAALQNGNSLINPSQDDALMSLLQRGQSGGNPQQITYDNQIELNVTVQGGQEAEDWARNTFSRLVEESMTHFPSR